MKKIINGKLAFFAFGLFMAMFVASYAQAAITVSYTPDKEQVAVGETITVIATLNAVPSLKSLGGAIYLNFDHTLLQLTVVENGDPNQVTSNPALTVTHRPMETANTNGEFFWSYASFMSPITLDGMYTVGIATFKAQKEGTVSFVTSDTNFYNENGGLVPDSELTLNSPPDIIIGAVTGPLTVTFAVNDANMGSITGTTSQSIANGGSTTAVTAKAADGYDFVNWTGTGGFSNTDTTLTVPSVTQDMTITANFVAETFAVNSISTTSATEGATITVSGSGFDNTATVLFAAQDGTTTAATSVSYTNSNTLVATVPDLSAQEGPFNITVRLGDNSEATLQGTNFTYGEQLPGDADNDGTVNIFDALLIAQYVVDNTIEIPGMNNADVFCEDNTADVKITINDALAIAKYDVGLTDAPTICQ